MLKSILIKVEHACIQLIKCIIFQFSSDTAFKNPIIRQAELTSRFAPTYLYQFSFQGLSNMLRKVKVPSKSKKDEFLDFYECKIKTFMDDLLVHQNANNNERTKYLLLTFL